MRALFEDSYDDMIKLLKDTIDNYALAYEIDDTVSLFSVAQDQFQLMQNVAKLSKHQVVEVCKNICAALCEEQNIDIERNSNLKEIDFVMNLGGSRIGVIVSSKQLHMPMVDKAIEQGITSILVVVLEDSKSGNPRFIVPNTFSYRQYPYKKLIKNVTIKQFFEMIGASDYDDFMECVGRYRYEAEQALGITVSAIPTDKTLEKHKMHVEKELCSLFYKEQLLNYFSDKEINYMKQWFDKNYKVLLADSNFSKSLISSEWYYDLQNKTDCGMDQTAIIAGYLKSVEQLVFSVLLGLCEEYDFYFYTTKAAQERTGQNRMPLTLNNSADLKTMARNIMTVVENTKHIVLYKTAMTDRVIEYLNNYFSKLRNGYFHKDNIYEWEEIEKIRESTYCAYFMILSLFKIK